MFQNPEKNTLQHIKGQQASKPLETVVNVLIKNQAKQKRDLKQSRNYDVLYNDIKDVLSSLDISIGDCKRYNQAKIHRKYQIKIADLQNQVKILKQKLKEQQNARSPSKKYVQDLVDQLVFFKSQNQRLKLQIQQLYRAKQQMQQKAFQQKQKLISSRHTALTSRQLDTLQKSLIQNEITSNKQSFSIKDSIIQFLQKQKQKRNISYQTRSKFEGFLKKNVVQLSNMEVVDFLSQINKWVSKTQKKKQDNLSSRLKSNIFQICSEQKSEKKLPKINYLSTIVKKRNDYSCLTKKRQKHRPIYSTIQISNKIGTLK